MFSKGSLLEAGDFIETSNLRSSVSALGKTGYGADSILLIQEVQ